MIADMQTMATSQTKVPGLVLIFSHMTFSLPELEQREGNEHDVSQLIEILTSLQYQVRVFTDQTKKEVFNTLNCVISEDLNHFRKVIVIVLTHGGKGGVLYALDCEYYTKDVWEPLINCPKLRNKPKIFVFQACRGRKEESRFQINSAVQPDIITNLGDMSVPVNPHAPDCIVAYSTVEDNVSKRDLKSGTVFISALCNTLRQTKEQPMDLLTLFTNVNSAVMNHDQTSTFTSFLHNSVLVGLNQNQPSTSGSSQLRNDAQQGVVRTAYPRNGKIMILILYTTDFEKKAKSIRSTVERLRGADVKLFANLDDKNLNLLQVLNAVTKSPDSENMFIEVDTLLVLGFAQQFEETVTANCERKYLRTKHPSLPCVPINSILGQFTASQCQGLRGKPKLFLFFDPYRTDDPLSQEVPNTEFSESVTNQSDFLIATIHGNESIGEVQLAMENPTQEITQMLTTVMRKKEGHVAHGRNVRLSHLDSTLRMSCYLSPVIQQNQMVTVENVQPNVQQNVQQYVQQNQQQPFTSNINSNDGFAYLPLDDHSASSRLVTSNSIESTRPLISREDSYQTQIREETLDCTDSNAHRQESQQVANTMQSRSHTNITSLPIFLLFLCGWFAIAGFAFMTGDPRRLLYPVDYLGQRCGLDEMVREKPTLFYLNLTKCASPNTFSMGCSTTRVCRKECPTEDFIAKTIEDIKETGGQLKKDVICKYYVHEHYYIRTFPNEYIQEHEYCGVGHWNSISFANHCLPTSLLKVSNSTSQLLRNIEEDMEFGNQIIREVATLASLAEVEAHYEHFLQDMMNSWPLILAGLLESAVLCAICVYFVRRITNLLVWATTIGVVTLLLYGIYVCYERLSSLKSCSVSQFLDSKIPEVCEWSPESHLMIREFWIILMIVCCLLLVIIPLVMIFLRLKINYAIRIIREAGTAVMNITPVQIFPTLLWLLHLAVLTLSIQVWLNLLSSRSSKYRISNYKDSCNCPSYKNGAECDVKTFTTECFIHRDFAKGCQDVICALNKYPGIGWLQAYNIIGAFWSTFFIFAFQKMVLAGSFANWYWAKRKSKLKCITLHESLLRTVRFHMGTLALGSLLNFVCGLLCLVPDCVHRQLKKCPDYVILSKMKCCCNAIFLAIEKFHFFFNPNAYILCAIHGCNLQSAAKRAIVLLRGNSEIVVMFDKLPFFLLFLCKLLITLFAMMQWSLIFGVRSDLNYYMLPVFTIGLGTYIIATLFFRVYSTAIDTLFICCLEDCEQNDGSAKKPYFMSSELRKIFNVGRN